MRILCVLSTKDPLSKEADPGGCGLRLLGVEEATFQKVDLEVGLNHSCDLRRGQSRWAILAGRRVRTTHHAQPVSIRPEPAMNALNALGLLRIRAKTVKATAISG